MAEQITREQVAVLRGLADRLQGDTVFDDYSDDGEGVVNVWKTSGFRDEIDAFVAVVNALEPSAKQRSS